MKQTKLESILSSLIILALGILCVIYKGGVISIAMTILGVFLIVYGILNIVNHLNVIGIIKIVAGVLFIVCGWLITSIVLYIVAALLLLYGIYSLYLLIKNKTKGIKWYTTLLIYLFPVLEIAVAILLFCNMGGTVDTVFIIIGVLLIVSGVVDLIKGLLED